MMSGIDFRPLTAVEGTKVRAGKEGSCCFYILRFKLRLQCQWRHDEKPKGSQRMPVVELQGDTPEGRSRLVAIAALMMMDEECPTTSRSIPSVRDMEGV
jgi:hypothetical protein